MRHLFLFSHIRQVDFACWTLQNKAFRLIRVYAPNISTELPGLFQQIELFLTISRWVILAGGLNAVLDLNIDRTRERSGINNRDVKLFRYFIGKYGVSLFCGLQGLFRYASRGLDSFIDMLGLMKQESLSLWPLASGLKCFTNDDTSLTLWPSGFVQQDWQQCFRCVEDVETIVRWLIEDFMFRMLHGVFFTFKASSVCSNWNCH